MLSGCPTSGREKLPFPFLPSFPQIDFSVHVDRNLQCLRRVPHQDRGAIGKESRISKDKLTYFISSGHAFLVFE